MIAGYTADGEQVARTDERAVRTGTVVMTEYSDSLAMVLLRVHSPRSIGTVTR